MMRMSTQRKILSSAGVVLWAVILLTGCGGSSSSSAVPVVPLTPSATKTWTVMVFMNGDNNLEDAAFDDLNEMERVGSSDDVNIVVQADYYDSLANTYRYYITQDSNTQTVSSSAVSTLSEQDMSDPDVLKDFITWAVTYYPAEHYVLVLWNHGAGWKGEEQGDQHPLFRGISSDDTSESIMSITQLRSALTDAAVTFDIIGFDACLMGMLEVAYEVKDNAAYMVGSEDNEPGDGWPYDLWLQYLVNNPTADASTLASQIVDEYYTSYSSARVSITQSAFDLSKMSDLRDAVYDFGNQLKDDVSLTDVGTIRSSTQQYSDTKNVDLYRFAELVNEDSGTSSAAQSAAQAVMDQVDATVVNSRYLTATGSNNLDNSHGISIFFPTSSQITSNDHDAYQSLKFVEDSRTVGSGWQGFISNYYTNGSGDTPSSSLVSADFRFAITWDADVDIDLVIYEPDPDGDYAVATPWYSTTSINGFLSGDSAVTGDSEESFQSKSDVYPGNYYFLVNYYQNGTATSANVTYNLYINGAVNNSGVQNLDATSQVNLDGTGFSDFPAGWWYIGALEVSTQGEEIETIIQIKGPFSKDKYPVPELGSLPDLLE